MEYCQVDAPLTTPSPHIGQTIQRRKVSWVVDADMEGLLKFLEQRIGDRRVWRMIWQILKSGVMEDGLEEAGNPPPTDLPIAGSTPPTRPARADDCGDVVDSR